MASRTAASVWVYAGNVTIEASNIWNSRTSRSQSPSLTTVSGGSRHSSRTVRKANDICVRSPRCIGTITRSRTTRCRPCCGPG